MEFNEEMHNKVVSVLSKMEDSYYEEFNEDMSEEMYFQLYDSIYELIEKQG